MIIGIEGEEIVEATPELLWSSLNSPEFLVQCIPGCKSMVETAADTYRLLLELRVASVGGGFEGQVALTDKQPPAACRMSVTGGGTLGSAAVEAQLLIQPNADGRCVLSYRGSGEVDGLVAGVGQRVLRSVSKYLIGQFFKSVRARLATLRETHAGRGPSAPSGQYVVSDDGQKLFVMVDGKPSEPPVVLAGSLAATSAMWSDQVPALRAAGLRVIRFDTRGHGRSDAPPGPYSLERLGRDALAVISAVGDKQVAFCGLSLGGLVGLWLALEAPERLTRLCLANSAPAFSPASMWRERADTALLAGMSALVEPTVARWLTPAFQAAEPTRTEAIRRMIADTSAVGYAGCCAALGEADLSPRLPSVGCPTLVIGALVDRSTPVERARQLSTAIPGARLTLLNAAHLSNVEAAGDFNRALIDHLTGAAQLRPMGVMHG